MKKFLLAAVAVTMVATGTTATAQQDRYVSYSLPLDGGCGFVAISDGTDSPQTQWDGEIHAVAMALGTALPAPTEWVYVKCELRINGATPGAFVHYADGMGVAAGAKQFSFNADPDDVLTMCTHVGKPWHDKCNAVTTRAIVPAPVAEAIDDVKELIDDVACRHIASMSGGPADQPPAFDIRSDGDLYIQEEWVWDCPPYDSSGT